MEKRHAKYWMGNSGPIKWHMKINRKDNLSCLWREAIVGYEKLKTRVIGWRIGRLIALVWCASCLVTLSVCWLKVNTGCDYKQICRRRCLLLLNSEEIGCVLFQASEAIWMSFDLTNLTLHGTCTAQCGFSCSKVGWRLAKKERHDGCIPFTIRFGVYWFVHQAQSWKTSVENTETRKKHLLIFSCSFKLMSDVAVSHYTSQQFRRMIFPPMPGDKDSLKTVWLSLEIAFRVHNGLFYFMLKCLFFILFL